MPATPNAPTRTAAISAACNGRASRKRDSRETRAGGRRTAGTWSRASAAWASTAGAGAASSSAAARASSEMRVNRAWHSGHEA